MKLLAVASTVWFGLIGSAAPAQEPVDMLHVSGQADFLQSATGGTGTVEWFHAAGRDGIRVGVQSGSLADAWWTYGRAGGFVRRRGAVFSGTLETGGGRQQAGAFGYHKLSVEAAAPVAKGRLLVETEGQVARMASSVSRILRFGAKWQLSNAVAAGGSYYLVSHDRSVSPAVCARLDLEHGRTSVLGGVVLARPDRSHVLLNEIGGLPRTSTEVFGGWGRRAASYRLMIVAQGSDGANRLLVSIQVPLRLAQTTTKGAKGSLASPNPPMYADR
jgi:hypothetical protein